MKSLWHAVTEFIFKPRWFEKWGTGRIYKFLGVKYPKAICCWIGKMYGKKVKYSQNYRIWDRSKKGLKAFERWTRFNESIHLFFGLLVAFSCVSSFISGNWGDAIFELVICFIHGFLVILQRYNRARLYSVISRMN